MPDMPAEQYTGPDRRKPDAATVTAIRAAVADGLRDAVSDPALWEAAGRAMREQAQSAAGGWLLGGLGGIARRAAWVVAIAAGVYILGGWGALVALFKAQGLGPH